jgi:hypothetical protein
MKAISLHHSFNKSKQGERGALHHSDPMHPQLNTYSHLTQQQDGCGTKAQHWPQQKGWIPDSFRPFILTF